MELLAGLFATVVGVYAIAHGLRLLRSRSLSQNSNEYKRLLVDVNLLNGLLGKPKLEKLTRNQIAIYGKYNIGLGLFALLCVLVGFVQFFK